MFPSVKSEDVEGSPIKVIVGDGEEPVLLIDDLRPNWLWMEPIVIGINTRKFTVPRNKRVNCIEKQKKLSIIEWARAWSKRHCQSQAV